jgi:hypothetical protein
MDNLDDEPSLCRLLQEFGSNHFFYDCQESHLRMMRDEFFNSLVDCLTGSNEELDVELADDWEIVNWRGINFVPKVDYLILYQYPVRKCGFSGLNNDKTNQT